MLFSRKPLLLLASCLWTCTAQSVNAVHSVKNRTISVGNETFVINPTHVVVESHAIVPGGAALTVNGHPVSVDSGHDLFVGTLEVITAAATATTRGPINTVPAFRNSSIPLGTGLPGTEITSSDQHRSATDSQSKALPYTKSRGTAASAKASGSGSRKTYGAGTSVKGTSVQSSVNATNSQTAKYNQTSKSNPGSTSTTSHNSSTKTSTGPPPSGTNVQSTNGDFIPIGTDFVLVGTTTLSDASTTAVYDDVLLTQFESLKTPTVVVTDFPELNSKGSTTLVQGSIIIGKGGYVLIHPPSRPTDGVHIGPPGLGGPIRPPSSGSKCPSFFGISFCPPGFPVADPGSPDVDPADNPAGSDPENPGNEDDPASQKSQDQTSETSKDHSSRSGSTTRPSSVSATTTSSETKSSSASTSSSNSSTGSSSSSSSACSASASGCGCITLDFDVQATPAPGDDGDDPGNSEEKRFAGRWAVEKRAVTQVNLASQTSSTIGGCSVPKYTAKPPYPGPKAVRDNQADPPPNMKAFYETAQYWAVPVQAKACDPPTWQLTKDLPAGWVPGGNTGKSVNVDHVYELSILADFFTQQVSAGFSCDDITAPFPPNDDQSGTPRLNDVFAQLPSLTNPDFLGMSSKLNLLKGKLWNNNLAGAEKDLTCLKSDGCIQNLSNLAVIFAMVNDPRIVKLFSDTNARLYSAFLGIDDIVKGESGCGGPVRGANGQELQATWADAYKKYVTDKITSNNDLITKSASSLSASVITDVNDLKKPKDAGSVKNWATYMQQFNAQYDVNSFTFPTPDDWPDNAMQIQKRAGATDPTAACTAGGGSTSGSASKSQITLATPESSVTSKALTSSMTVSPPLITLTANLASTLEF